MKRVIALLLCLAVLLALGGCGRKKATTEDLLQGALDQAGDLYDDALDQAGDMLESIDGLTSDVSGLVPDIDGVNSDTGEHTHTFASATCEEPQTCECGETRGSALGHSFSSGKCNRCGGKDPNYIEVNYVNLSDYSYSLYTGESFTLSATVGPDNATNQKISWTSSNSAVASVSSGGKVTAKSAGNAAITAKSSNGKTATCKVTVEVDPLAGYSLITPALPKEISYKSDSTVYYTSKITSISYDLEEEDEYITIKLVLSGQKTFDRYGSDNSSDCCLPWKLYDSKNNVVKTGSIYTPNLCEGESYAYLRSTIVSYYDYLPIDTYRLEFVDYT